MVIHVVLSDQNIYSKQNRELNGWQVKNKNIFSRVLSTYFCRFVDSQKDLELSSGGEDVVPTVEATWGGNGELEELELKQKAFWKLRSRPAGDRRLWRN